MAKEYVVFPHHDRGNAAAPVTTSRPAHIAASTL